MKKIEVSANITDIAIVEGSIVCKVEIKTSKENIWYKWINYATANNASDEVLKAQGKKK